MIAHARERAAEAAKNHVAAMFNLGELAMYGNGRPDDLAAKSLAQSLVAEANPKDWDAGGRGLNQFEANPRILRPARARREHDGVGCLTNDLRNTHLVIAVHCDIGAKPPEAMDQVPGETVVIIDERDGRHPRLTPHPRSFGPRLAQGQDE